MLFDVISVFDIYDFVKLIVNFDDCVVVDKLFFVMIEVWCNEVLWVMCCEFKFDLVEIDEIE